MKSAPLGLLAFLAFVPAAHADELRLKDGTKIIGTIIGFENDSFKVQTSYGFAIVQKDKIAAIIPSEAKPEVKKETKKEVAPEAKKPSPAPATSTTAPPPAAAPATAPAAKKETSPPRAVSPAARPAMQINPPPTAAIVAPPPVAEPPPPAIRDEVQGNLYINHTYGFRMYKPPGWRIIEDARKALPSAILAMGTDDETTLLVVGREALKDSLQAHAAAVERQLREIYDNYRRLSEHHTRVAGMPAFARRYRGTLEGHDWSGVALSFARGNDVFTVLGMTYADSDLIQIQENVIAKTIASLEFTNP